MDIGQDSELNNFTYQDGVTLSKYNIVESVGSFINIIL